MNAFKLLDCTLRDGGYVNDWNFGHNTLINVFERVTSAHIDFIEVGFLDQRRPFDINRSIMPHSADIQRIYGGLDQKNTKIVAMIDYGTCDLQHIQPCEQSMLDGIRVIFKKHIKEEALAFAQKLKDLGYIVFTQAVSITSYDDHELIELIRLVNQVKPYALSIVDTYGLLHKNPLFHYYEMMNAHLEPEIGIGYHSHNNFQLAYANSIELISRHGSNPRTLLVDGSVFGMGKGAGNAPIELLAMYMNEHCEKQYDISQLLEAIDVNIYDIFKRTPWGYSMKYFLAASNDCHPNYVAYLLDKKTVSVKSINEILQDLSPDKKLNYDQTYIEDQYINYQKHTCDDTQDYQRLKSALSGRQILVLGPGSSIVHEREKIQKFIEQHQPLVIAINFIPEDLLPNYLFLTNSKRYVQQATHIAASANAFQTIATSNVTKSCGNFDFQLDFESLIDRNAVFMDNSFIMLLKALIKLDIKQVALAGLDGYDADRISNYYASEMEYEFVKHQGEQINQNVNQVLTSLKDILSVEFVTTTVYLH